KEGQPIRVIAFTNAPQVELFLNGKSLGVKDHPHDDIVEWQVPFEPGQLTARGYKDGKTITTEQLETTGRATRIELSPDRKNLRADGQDAVVVPVTLFDEKGRVVFDSSNQITFQLKGNGRILGVSNGNPADHDPEHATQRNAFHGHCIAVIQAGSQPGS